MFIDFKNPQFAGFFMGKIFRQYKMNRDQLIVIKVGSAVMANHDRSVFLSCVKMILDLINSGMKPIIVSSGAVAKGAQKLKQLGLNCGGNRTELKPMLATVGQAEIINQWAYSLNTCVAQVLVDRQHLNDRMAFKETYSLIENMVNHKIIPIINENDGLNRREKSLGNNDLLAAMISTMLGVKWLLMYTDIDALYSDFPNNSKRVIKVDVSDPVLNNVAKGTNSSVGTGGMFSKIVAAKTAASSGVHSIIGNDSLNVFAAMKLNDCNGTLLVPSDKTVSKIKCWLKETAQAKGQIIIDSGATHAISFKKASLLSNGVENVVGSFNKRDVVELVDFQSKRVLAKGFSKWTSKDLKEFKCLTAKSQQKIKNQSSKQVVVHRNDMVLMG